MDGPVRREDGEMLLPETPHVSALMIDYDGTTNKQFAESTRLKI